MSFGNTRNTVGESESDKKGEVMSEVWIEIQKFSGVILASSLTSAVVTTALNSWLESRKARRFEKLDALKIAVALEGYAIGCADKIGDHRTAESSDGHAGRYMANLPSLPDMDVSPGLWNGRKVNAVGDMLIFTQEICQAEQRVVFWWDVVGDMECVRNEAVEQSAKMGLRSIEIASNIREAFGLPERELVFGEYEIKAVLKNKGRNP